MSPFIALSVALSGLASAAEPATAPPDEPAEAEVAPAAEAPAAEALAPASAEKKQDTFEAHAWAEAGYASTTTSGEETPVHGPFLGIARLSSRFTHDLSRFGTAARFGSFVQLGADGGDLKLLDARVDFSPRPWLHVHAGRFKTSVSADYLVPAPKMIFVNRALLTQLVPGRRVGVEATVKGEVGPAEVDAQVGVFNPDGTWEPAHDGQLLTGRARVALPGELAFHAAWAEQLPPDDRSLTTDPYQRRLDGAITYENSRVVLAAEGLLARPLDDDRLELGWTASAAYATRDPEQGFAVEPAIAYDELRVDGEPVRRASGALNLFWDGWRMVQTFGYEATFFGDEVEHLAVVQIQAGI